MRACLILLAFYVDVILLVSLNLIGGQFGVTLMDLDVVLRRGSGQSLLFNFQVQTIACSERMRDPLFKEV